MSQGWIGVDLDGTLAVYDGWKGIDHIGEPIEPMVEYVKSLLAAGVEVRIFTARVQEGLSAEDAIDAWTRHVFGYRLPITATKDFDMIFCIDDRAVSVEKNTGRFLVHPPTLEAVAFYHSPHNPENPAYVGPSPQADGDDGH